MGTITMHRALLIAAAVCFGIGTIGVDLGRVNPVALALLLWSLTLILPGPG